ncbi:AAA family ATPase [Streptomyces xiamenensis]|uniref:AAA family ATPase n=1 Tax=Streptomyces xiamenensis TaxID=408015 RepID=UPI0035DDF550
MPTNSADFVRVTGSTLPLPSRDRPLAGQPTTASADRQPGRAAPVAAEPDMFPVPDGEVDRLSDLVIPQWPDDAVFLLVGPPAAGKSTFARTHFDPEWRINLDSLRRAASGDAADQSATRAAVKIQNTLLRERLSRGLPTVIDSTNGNRWAREGIRRLAIRYRRPLIVFLFDVSPDDCKAGNAARRRHVPDDVMERLLRKNPTAEQLRAEGFLHVLVLRRPADTVTPGS